MNKICPHKTIFLGLGANLPSRFGTPFKTLLAALDALDNLGVKIVARSRWYRSPAYPDPTEPEFVNSVISVETHLCADDLLHLLLDLETNFGRKRKRRWAPRVIDVDILDYQGQVYKSTDGSLTLPHPRFPERDFVLLPLRDVAPLWFHPVTGISIDKLISALPGPLTAEPLDLCLTGSD